MSVFAHPLRALAIAACLPPTLIWLMLWLTPDVVTHIGNAGTFIDANVTTGGYFSDTMSSIHTSTGTYMVYGPYSAPRGQTLVIRETTRTGLELCARCKADTCVILASPYDGPMHRVAPPPPGLSHAARATWNNVALFWLSFGVLVLVIALVAVQAERDEAQNDRRPDG